MTDVVVFEIFKGFLKGAFHTFMSLWYFWLLIVGVLAVRIYLQKYQNIKTMDDLVFRFLQLFNKDPQQDEKYLSGNAFPKAFVWLSKEEYMFGNLGSISFRKGENISRDMFELLTEAKGDFVRVQKIASLMSKTGNEVRVFMNVLSARLQKDPEVAPFINVISLNEGAYRLAVKESVLEKL